MDGIKLNLAGLKDKVASKLENSKNKGKNSKKNHKKDNKSSSDDLKTSSTSSKSSNKESTTKKGKPKNSSNPELEEAIRREALELGATEDDLKLLEDIEDNDEQSEQEFDDDGKTDKGFGDDLSKFMKSIGLENNKPIVVDDAQVEEEEGIDQDEDEEQEEAEEEQSEEQAEEAEEEQEQMDEAEESEENDEEDSAPSVVAKPEITHRRVDPTTVVNTAKLIIPPQLDWYNIPLELSNEAASLTDDQIAKLYQRGKEALENDNKTYYDEFSKTSSQRKFLSQVLSDGTLSDKISALTLLIQEAPVHNVKSLEMILNFTSKKSRNSSLQSINALKDLFVNGLLPDRRLRHFKNQPLSLMLSKKQLALFYFEDFLKNLYFKVIQVLEKLCHDPIIHVRMNVVSHIFDLLKSKPEQEVNLLRLGVNKIGDIDNKVSSKTSFQILQLQQAHPNMKKIIIESVIDAAFKKNTEYHSDYYSILTLNQTILTRREEEIANELVKTYFALFEKLLLETDSSNVDTVKKDNKPTQYKDRKKNFKKGKKGGKSVKNDKTDEEVVEEKNSKLFSALLTGLNRSFPFSNLPDDVFSKHLETLYKITHSSNFNTSVQALVFIFQIIQSQKVNTDRFYRTLYESLFDSRLITSSKQGIYLNLLFKALKEDKNIPRVLSFVKRIIQICYNWVNIGPVAGMFYLLMELEKSVPQVRNLAINTPVDFKYIEDDEETSKDNEEGEKDEKDEEKTKEIPQYDGRKRDPRFSNANYSSIWEINEFLNHYHPTVQIYAESFLNQGKQQKPELGLFTLSHFLDRFVYRNAKQKPVTKGSSIMQPLGGAHTGSLLVKASNRNAFGELSVNTENWLNKRAEEVKPDEQFFYQYFTSKEKDPSKLNEPREEDFENESDLDDEEVWDALVKSQPEIDGDLGSDIDDFSDFDNEDFSDIESDEEAEAEEGDLIDENEDEDVDSSDIELQAIDDLSSGESGQSDQSDEEEESGDEDDDIKFKGFSESEDEEEQSNDEEEVEEKSSSKSKKRSLQVDDSKNSKKSKKSKFKELPVFASADDYAQYLNSDEEN